MLNKFRNSASFTPHQFLTDKFDKINSIRNGAGFTLIEVITTVAIFAIAMGLISGFLVYIYRIHGYALQQAQAIGEARRGIEIMVKEIREAKSGEDGAYLIGKTENFELSFYLNVDKDLEVEMVSYYIEGTDLIKEIIDPEGFPSQYSSQPKKTLLSQYVRNTPPIFKYFDEKGEELAYPARKKDTRMIKVYLEINVNPSRFPLDFILESVIRFRNL